MWRDWLLHAAQLIGSLMGAVLLAALLATLSQPTHGFWPFASAVSERFLDTFRGDFGRSAVTGAPAMADVVTVLPLTLQLLAGGAVAALLLGVPLGILLIIGGIFSFLPVLGLWMLPLGLMLIAQDIPFLQGPIVRLLTWMERKWIERQRARAEKRGEPAP